MLVCIDRRTDTHAAIAASGHFGISVLAEGQDEVSRRFASPRRDKFEELPTTEGPHQSPLIPGALAHLECRVDAAHEAGDHTIFVGEVVWLQSAPGRPLVYQRSGYHQLKG